jgi:hypothetical protein
VSRIVLRFILTRIPRLETTRPTLQILRFSRREDET